MSVEYYKDRKTVEIECFISLSNPEDKFNDMIEEGCTVHEALIYMMRDAVVENKVEKMYPNYNVKGLTYLADDTLPNGGIGSCELCEVDLVEYID
jgi:hypothetical protein